jgi:hypothetical protein
MKNIIFILIAGLMLTGCPGKESNNSNLFNNYGGNGIFPGCPTCSGGTASLFQGSAYSSRISMTAQFAGDGNQITQIMYSGMSPAKVYSGQSTMGAAINVTQPYYAGGCVIPPGQYQIQSLSVGSWQMGSFNFPQAQMSVGGYPIQVSVSGVIVNDANGAPGGFGAQIRYITCGDTIGVTLAPY